jgi:hypothetical protein
MGNVRGYYESKQIGKANVFLIMKTLWKIISTTIMASKWLIYNHATIVPWKYEELLNKISCQKIKELYYSCKMDICVLKCIHHKYNCS